MSLRIALTLLAACSALASSAQAAPQANAAAVATAEQNLPSGAASEVVRNVVKLVRENYVHAERVNAIVARLEAALESGRYATSSPAELAERVSADLKQASGGDGHMYINFNPAEAKARSSPDAEQGPDEAYFRRLMEASNHGITELKILPGNVRYMNISQWFWDEASTRRAYDDAMRFLRDGDAIIIDISKNGGGSADAVNYLVSHFMQPDQKLMTFRNGPAEVEETRTQHIESGQISGKPLVVLIGPRSASASEEFASHVRHFQLGTLVGQKTAGAGNPNSLFPVVHGFVLSVSTGLAIHPVTGKGWEGEGVAPHQVAELSGALNAAHLEAVRARLASAPADQRAELEWVAAALSGSESAPPPTPDQLGSFVGSYEGERRVTQANGRLYWQRGTNPKLELIPLGGSRFAIGDRFGPRVEFTGATGLQFLRPGAEAETVRRVRS